MFKTQKYSIRKNWLETLYLIKTKPIVLMPFLYIGFFEGLALEIAWFSTRFPFSYVANPMIRKFFGENFVHYPGIMLILPKLFYFGQILVWTFMGAFLSAMTVMIFKNLIEGLPIKVEDLVKKAIPNYFSFSILAVVVGVLFYLMTDASMSAVSKILGIIPTIMILYILKFILLTLVISAVPLILFDKLDLFSALKNSVIISMKNFSTMFIMIFVPFLVYFPVFFAKNFCAEKYADALPEINLYLSMAGIVFCMFLGCFIILCVSRFLLDRAQAAEGKLP